MYAIDVYKSSKMEVMVKSRRPGDAHMPATVNQVSATISSGDGLVTPQYQATT